MTQSESYTIDYGSVRAAVRERYPDWVALYTEVESKARALQHEPKVHRENVQELLVAVLYARTLATVTAAMLTAEHGYDVQCRVLLRSAMEVLFSMVAIAKDAELAEAFVLADEAERRRMLRKSRSWSSPKLQKQAALHATDEKLREIEEGIEAANAKPIKVEEMAKAGGLHDWYLTAYAVFSSSVHNNVRDLERHLVVTADREIEAIRNEPVTEQLDKLFLTAIEILLKAMEALSLVFNLDTKRFHAKAIEKLQVLALTSGKELPKQP